MTPVTELMLHAELHFSWKKVKMADEGAIWVSGKSGSYGRCKFNVLENAICCFPKWFYHFTLPLAVYGISDAPHPCQSLV